jgi:hypothetical protein
MSDMRTFVVDVTQRVTIRLDAAKFDEEFAKEFNSYITDFGLPSDVLDDMLDNHAEHLAQMQARGVVELDSYSGEFVEGYGPSKEMGISATTDWTETEIVSRDAA